MDLVGFLKSALKCFDFLAWPLFALGCPLYASIRAIETNSNSDMRNLVAYWISFSLISLFELAFLKLIEWLPFWPYMKLMAICWLGLPNFNGACYVYECLIRPCLSVNPQGVIKRFIKQKKDVPLNAESFLVAAERYVKENGSEALEKLIDRKSKHTTPNIEVEEIKAVTNTEEKEMAAPIQSFKEPNVAKEDDKAVEPKEKIPTASTHWSKFKEPNAANEHPKEGELKEKNPSAATEWVKCVEVSNLAQTEKKTIAAREIKEKTVTAAVGDSQTEKKAREIKEKTVPADAQTEKKTVPAWEIKKQTMTPDSQTEKKTVAAREIKEKTVPADAQTEKKTVPAWEIKKQTMTPDTQTEKKTVAAREIKEKTVTPDAQTEKKTVAAKEIKVKTVTSAVKENKVGEVTPVAAGGENKATESPASENVQKEWTCAVCQVVTTCEKNLKSHLDGRKHKAKSAQLEASKQANKNKGCWTSTANQEPKKPVSGDQPNQNKSKKQEEKAQVNQTSEQCKQKEVKNTDSGDNKSKLWCIICNVKCLSEVDMASHLIGRKHLSHVQNVLNSVSGGH